MSTSFALAHALAPVLQAVDMSLALAHAFVALLQMVDMSLAPLTVQSPSFTGKERAWTNMSRKTFLEHLSHG